ncbi:MAG: PKD domain-containing protein, partial [Acidimicrobiia bacterium]|nr:PKD domain-containing protein [Acidimicrobiia bacterium]
MSRETGRKTHGRTFRLTLRALLATLVGALVALFLVPAASAQKVANPGSFTLSLDTGEINIKTTSFDVGGAPACSNGEDDASDTDTLADYPADPQCAGPDDNSELLSGHQPVEPVDLTGTVDAAGNVSIPSSGVSFPDTWMEAPVIGVITVQILAVGTATGTLNPITGAVDVTAKLRIKLNNGSLTSGCYIGSASGIPIPLTTGTRPANGTMPAMTGTPYDSGDGSATLVDNTFDVPGATGCGALGLLNGTINSQLGLPSTDANSVSLTGSASPILLPGVVAAFTSSPSDLTAGFDASSSTAVAGVAGYAWDFGDGSPTGSGVSPSHTYAAAGVYDVVLTVTDTGGDSASVTHPVTVSAPPNLSPSAVASAAPTSGVAPLAVVFDGSGSIDPDGSVVSYSW